MSTEYKYHDITALCEAKGEEITVPVKYGFLNMSGTLYQGQKTLGPDCAATCLRAKQNDCSVIHAARKVRCPR